MSKPIIQKATKDDLHAIAEVTRDAWSIDKFIPSEICHNYSPARRPGE